MKYCSKTSSWLAIALLVLVTACQTTTVPTPPSTGGTPAAGTTAPSTSPATGSAPVVALTGTTRIKLLPSAAKLQVGQVTALTLQLEAGAQGVDGVEVHLDFDPSKLQVVDANQGAVAKIENPGSPFEIELLNRVDNPSGKVDFAAGTLSQNKPSGTKTVGTLRVKALAATGDGGTTIRFAIDRANNRATEVVNKGVSVLGGADNAGIVVTP